MRLAPLADGDGARALRGHRDRARRHDGLPRTCRSGRRCRPPASSRSQLPPRGQAHHRSSPIMTPPAPVCAPPRPPRGGCGPRAARSPSRCRRRKGDDFNDLLLRDGAEAVARGDRRRATPAEARKTRAADRSASTAQLSGRRDTIAAVHARRRGRSRSRRRAGLEPAARLQPHALAVPLSPGSRPGWCRTTRAARSRRPSPRNGCATCWRDWPAGCASMPRAN